MTKKIFNFLLVSFIVIAPFELTWARLKFDAGFGYFTISAKNSQGTGSLSGPGLYSIAIRKDVFGQFEYLAGYTILMSKVISGDLGFGPDLGVNYYPFSSSSVNVAETPQIKFISDEMYRPYLGLEFNQRTYQSVSASYAGFSITAGLEAFWTSNFYYHAKIRMSNLTGSQTATASAQDLLLGITYWY